ncbi:class I SAM-dependent methyltransferase [Bradyrhizobium sp. ORS 86]|uniref:class I SAM-dependent methyltransferase n=1 Tax=Bradyrhizobium sp. ORS 86 TaxID=1685970 RepID=UPI00388DD097
MPYPNDRFDAVICGYGVLHVPEPDRALAEMRRVLRPGGRVAISTGLRDLDKIDLDKITAFAINSVRGSSPSLTESMRNVCS